MVNFKVITGGKQPGKLLTAFAGPDQTVAAKNRLELVKVAGKKWMVLLGLDLRFLGQKPEQHYLPHPEFFPKEIMLSLSGKIVIPSCEIPRQDGLEYIDIGRKWRRACHPELDLLSDEAGEAVAEKFGELLSGQGIGYFWHYNNAEQFTAGGGKFIWRSTANPNEYGTYFELDRIKEGNFGVVWGEGLNLEYPGQ